MLKIQSKSITQYAIVKTNVGDFRVDILGSVEFYLGGNSTHGWFPCDDEIVIDLSYQFSREEIDLISSEGLQMLSV